jgi:hypothetical protein
MTIREHLRFRHLTALGFGVGLTLVGYIVCYFLEANRPGLNTHPLLTAPLVAILIVAIATRGGFDSCPRCKANLAKFSRAQFGGDERRPVWQVFDRCPNCGVSFDDPYPPPRMT